jgi:hypothetical protein
MGVNSAAALVAMKQAGGRPRDLTDVELLQSLDDG